MPEEEREAMEKWLVNHGDNLMIYENPDPSKTNEFFPTDFGGSVFKVVFHKTGESQPVFIYADKRDEQL